MSKSFKKKRDRLQLIDRMIRQGGCVQEAAAIACGVSVRTVREDFSFLRELGAPLECHGKNGWKYSEEWEMKL
jgi:predicted DNA-binding transcriptional regulator YafY